MTAEAGQTRYARVAIAFHWVIAALILANFPIAWTMGDKGLDKSASFALFQLHKTIGITVLLLSFGRLAWRLMNPPPALPDTMKPWEKLLSHSVHILFYVAMIGTPLLGWMMVSASPTGIPTYLFGFIHWPHIGPLADLPISAKKGVHEFFEEGHELAAWLILVLLGLHVAGALKHQLLDKENILVRMAPGLFGRTGGPANPPKGAPVALGVVAVLLAIGAAIGALGGAPEPAPAAVTAKPAAPAPVPPGAWVVDQAASKIAFSGKNQGKPFEGAFGQWSAQIVFDPANLAAASASVAIQTASAKTGDAYYDSTLPSADWFDAAKNPTATFTAKTFRATGPNAYAADGQLTIRGVSKPITLPFELKIEGGKAEMEAELTLKRLDFGIGKNADPTADWVGDPVKIEIELKAAKAG